MGGFGYGAGAVEAAGDVPRECDAIARDGGRN